MPCRRSMPLLLVLVAAAVAQTEWLTEREALAKGEQALREQRWDDAIAAFAQSDKSYPAPEWDGAAVDGRSRRLHKAIVALLDELERKGAPPAERLPYWDFYVQGFPFFSTRVRYGWEDALAMFDRCFLAAAEERVRQADLAGADERSALCRRVASAGAAEALDLLETGWSPHSYDFGLCACRAFHAIDADRRIDPDRRWKAYATHFSRSPYFGMAAVRWFREDDALEVASEAVAKRLCLLERGCAAMADPAEFEQVTSALAEFKTPWLPADLLEAWTTRVYLRASEETSQEGYRRLIRMTHERGGSPEVGLLLFSIAFFDYTETWPEIEDKYLKLLAGWEEVSADDPYLVWGVLWSFLRSSERPLGDEERHLLEGLAAKQPTEATRPFVECLLARDALAHGRGEEALARYEAAVAFDPGGVRLPAPFRAETAMAEAQSSLIEFWAIRDAKRLRPLFVMKLDTEGGYRQPVFCGNAYDGWERRSLRLEARPMIGGEDFGAALGLYEVSLLARVWDADAGIPADFASLCLRAGEPGRIGAMAERLEGLAAAETPREGYTPPRYGAFAKVLRDLAADADTVAGESLEETFRRIEDVSRDIWRPLDAPGWASIFDLPAAGRAMWIVDVLAQQGDVDARCASRLAHPADMAAVLLASRGDTDRSLDYLIDEYRDAPRGSQLCGSLGDAFRRRGEAAVRRAMERIALEGVATWPVYREILEVMSTEDVWRACTPFRTHADEAVRDLVEVILGERRQRDPWIVFALEGK